MCYNWLVAGDGGGVSNHRLDNLIENALMLPRTSKKYFVFALVQLLLMYFVHKYIILFNFFSSFCTITLKIYLTNGRLDSKIYFLAMQRRKFTSKIDFALAQGAL